ncbi:MAG TPA: L,D-transpeptidase family protein [Candidatus Competibacteraceae bacterium]|nr:L,D-transpeptidase family protein [Candidatus Competibacteraceae bacterium]
MSKRILVPVWVCTLLSACALNLPVEAQVADGQTTTVQNTAADTTNGSVVASLQAAPAPEDTREEMEPESNIEESSPPAEPVVTGPPPLPPCPESALSLRDKIAVQLCQQIRTEPPLTRLTVDNDPLRMLDTLIAFYAGRGYQPAWLNTDGKPRPAAEELLKALGEADRDGLRTADYHRAALRKRLTALQQSDAVADARRLTDFDLLFTDTFLTYGSHLLTGQLSPRKVDPDWAIKPRSRDLARVLEEALTQDQVAEALRALAPQAKGYVQLREMLRKYRKVEQEGGWPIVASSAPGKTLRVRLEASGDLSAGDKSQSVAEAVRRFQKRHGLSETGTVNAATLAALNVPVSERIRQIELNLERWRWMPNDLGSRYILVNIPSYKMQVFEEGKPVIESKVVVGKQERQTPSFTANMAYLVLSPKWYVPRSIAVKDKLPQLKRNSQALARQGIRVYNSAGQQINPGSVNWSAVSASNFNYQLRQDAGPRNALGGIKFMFPNPYSIYLHDTPSRELFSRNQRTYSSGCIRISNPVELAEYLLKHDPKWNKDTIKTASTSGKQRVVNLPQKVPVYLLYWTAWVDADGLLHFRDDIYQRDKPMMRALYQDEKASVKGA